MNASIAALTRKIEAMQLELETEIAKRHAELKFGLERGKIVFEEEVRRRHRELRTTLARYLLNAHPLVVITAPVIYSVIVPLILLDIVVTAYQFVCFPVYGIPLVRRRDYLVFDRFYLPYLNILEKINCAYCSYANGLIAYVREVAGRTELYWCPIKHARRIVSAHEQYKNFQDYGDADGFKALQSSAQIESSRQNDQSNDGDRHKNNQGPAGPS